MSVQGADSDSKEAPLRKHAMAKYVTKVLTADDIDINGVYYMPYVRLTGKEVLTTLLESYWYLLRTTPYPTPARIDGDYGRAVEDGYEDLRSDGIKVAQGVGKRPSTYQTAKRMRSTAVAHRRSARSNVRKSSSVDDDDVQISSSEASGEDDEFLVSTDSSDDSSSDTPEAEDSDGDSGDDKPRYSKSRRSNTASTTARRNSNGPAGRKATSQRRRALPTRLISDDEDSEDSYEEPKGPSKKRTRKAAVRVVDKAKPRE